MGVGPACSSLRTSHRSWCDFFISLVVGPTIFYCGGQQQASAHSFLIIFGYVSQVISLLAESIYLTSGNIMDYWSLQLIPAGQVYHSGLAAYHRIALTLRLTWSCLLQNLSLLTLGSTTHCFPCPQTIATTECLISVPHYFIALGKRMSSGPSWGTWSVSLFSDHSQFIPIRLLLWAFCSLPQYSAKAILEFPPHIL